jgi:hypothetical protein
MAERRVLVQCIFRSEQLGSFLKKTRSEQTFAQFSKKIGISSSTLLRIELGEQNLTLDTREHIMTGSKCCWARFSGNRKK